MSGYDENEQQEIVDGCIEALKQLNYDIEIGDNVRVSTLKLITDLAQRINKLEYPTS